MNEKSHPASKKTSGIYAFRVLSLMGSAPMAIVLLSLLSVICVIGSLIPQNEAFEFYQSHYTPQISSLIMALRLDRLYDSPWFILLLSFIAINLLISNGRRAKRLLKERNKPLEHLSRELFQSETAAVSLSAEREKEDTFSQILEQMGYSVYESKRSDGIFIHGEKGRIREWGSFITHLGLLIVFIGVIAGRTLPDNFSSYVEVDEGKTIAVKGRAFTLHLLSFRTEVNDRGMPRSHKSTVCIEEDGKITRVAKIAVNHPLRYRGVLFYQASCGMRSVEIEVRKGSDVTTLSFPLLPGGHIDVMDRFRVSKKPPLTVYIHNFFPHFIETDEGIGTFSPYPANPVIRAFVKPGSMDSKHRWEELGFIQAGKSVTKDGATFTFKRVVQWSGFLVRADSGMYIVWAGFIIVLIGLFISLYIPRRLVRALITDNESSYHFEIIPPEDGFSDKEKKKLSSLFPSLAKKADDGIPPGSPAA